MIDENTYTSIYVAGGEQLTILESTFLATEPPSGNRDLDQYDFAFAELTEKQCADLAAAEWVESTDISANRADTSKRAYMALGFPASKQKTNPIQSRVTTNPWTYVGFDRPQPQLARTLGISGEHHFFVKYDKRVKTFCGRVQQALKPKGASGGLLIDLGPLDPANLAPDYPCTGLVAGLLIEHHKRVHTIVAVRIQLVLAEIDKHLRNKA